ncbi:hypothetical protein FEM48_Zijuj04G0077000 [Ziziphus jujuba var. spinosa]|uniref:Uncharacterized protein n=1 Tax=Ziziphus jujuba var. spinosa TaxID=714518 RepID=A0A978VIM4_ZIZJJ|nr:hypothetical protein FEM48_Zijuj04G0077000 [Ziziphus jujuba var. spinosa]
MCQGSRVIVAASVGVMEALKEQGFCRAGNNPMRSIHKHAKDHLRSCSQQAKNLLSSPSSDSESENFLTSKAQIDQLGKLKQSEESLRTVMYLSCWGPNV